MIEVVKGKVRWFNNEKGYGFISHKDHTGEERDIFVHYSQIQMDGYKELKEGQEVEFSIVEDTKGKHAINVCVI